MAARLPTRIVRASPAGMRAHMNAASQVIAPSVAQIAAGPTVAMRPAIARGGGLAAGGGGGEESLHAKLRRAVLLQRRLDAGKRVELAKKFGLSLDYTPINLEVYTQAFDGAMAGLVGGRSPLLSYAAEPAMVAAVWAQELDTIWDSSSAINEVEAELILLGSYAAMDGRSASSTYTAAQAAPPITALLGNIVNALIELADMGITPNPWNSGGGSSGIVSGFGSETGVDLTAFPPQSLIGGEFSKTISSSAPRVNLFGVATYTPGQPSANVILELHIDGTTVNGEAFTPTSIDFTGVVTLAINWSVAVSAGSHTFDLAGYNSGGAGNLGSVDATLTMLATP